jgi:SAM-dependent methyltransferase
MDIKDPSFDYDKYGQHYSGYRQTDPRIAAYINRALGHAKTVLNVGAGSGSYEPTDRYVVAVEPSASMRTERLQNGRSPAIIGKADALPFDDNAFDASMAMVTVHHWPDVSAGLRELRRVTREQVIVMTFDPDSLHLFWNAHYFPELIAIERARYPPIDTIVNALGGSCEVVAVPVPLDCTDGFQEAFYGRPEAFLKKEVRQAQSAWGFLRPGLEDEYVRSLGADLASGAWDRRYGHFRTQPFFTCALRLVIARP